MLKSSIFWKSLNPKVNRSIFNTSKIFLINPTYLVALIKQSDIMWLVVMSF